MVLTDAFATDRAAPGAITFRGTGRHRPSRPSCRGTVECPVGCYQHEVKRTARAVERENPNWQLEP